MDDAFHMPLEDETHARRSAFTEQCLNHRLISFIQRMPPCYCSVMVGKNALHFTESPKLGVGTTCSMLRSNNIFQCSV